MKTALIIGSTGLIGTDLLHLLLNSPVYGNVVLFTRKDTGVTHPKLSQHIINFDQPESYSHLVKGEDFFCTIGTTIKKAGNREAFSKVDLDYPTTFARLAAANNIKRFLFISSIGADPDSSNFYLKTKGKLESVIRNIGIPMVASFRPSVLVGNRPEFRAAEKFGAFVMGLFSFLLIGNLKKYRPIKANVVAKALLSIAQQEYIGFKTYESDTIQQIARI